jgi:hypothetical protein
MTNGAVDTTTACGIEDCIMRDGASRELEMTVPFNLALAYFFLFFLIKKL